MAYTGEVRPGGPADVRELAQLMISKLSVGPMDNNAYLLRCRQTDVQVLVDAANDAPRLLELIGGDGIDAVITTHRHGDHWQALADVVDATGAAVLAHRADADELPVAVTRLIGDGDVIEFGAARVTAIHVAGHTPGGLVLVYDDPDGHEHLFTGDSLFPGGVGKTLDASSFTQLLGDVEHKVFARYPDEAWVYPGHGNDTTLGAERPHLGAWRARGW